MDALSEQIKEADEVIKGALRTTPRITVDEKLREVAKHRSQVRAQVSTRPK